MFSQRFLICSRILLAACTAFAQTAAKTAAAKTSGQRRPSMPKRCDRGGSSGVHEESGRAIAESGVRASRPAGCRKLYY